MTPGETGYRAYGDDAGWKTFDGRPMPPWSDVGPAVQRRWEAAALAILAESDTAGPQTQRSPMRLLGDA